MNNLKGFARYLLTLIMIFCVITFIGCNGCSTQEKYYYDNEVDKLVFSTQEVDKVFSPFFATTGPDNSVVGLTQIGMLGNDKKGNYTYGDKEAVVVKDLQIVTQGEDDDKKTTYYFVLKNNVRFSNNTPLTIKDVLFNLYVYLDPIYTGSSTIYSTDIVGLNEYRTQTRDENEQKQFEQQFEIVAETRIQALIDAATEIKDDHKDEDLTEELFKQYLAEYTTKSETFENVLKDYEKAVELYKEEINSDYINAMDGYKDITFVDENNKTYKDLLTTDVESFLYNYGYIYWVKKEGKLYSSLENDLSKLKSYTKEQAIEKVLIDKIPTAIDEIVQYWNTAITLSDYLKNAAKDAYYKEIKNNGDSIDSISGIKFANHKGSVTVNGVEYATPEYEADGTVKDGYNEVLSITINGVDPKAIWNFAFSVAPMYYYSAEPYISQFDYVANFGVDRGSTDFMNNIVKNSDKLGVPVGAGPYAASKNGGGIENIASGDFYNLGVIYYERNPYYVMGAPKIKNVRYQVVAANQMLNALYNKEIDFAEPNSKPEIITELGTKEKDGIGYKEIKTSGYGYIGINAGKVPDIKVRQAIMHSINTQECVNYYKSTAKPIYRSMSQANWAYPEHATPYYPYIGGKVPADLTVVNPDYAEYVTTLGKKTGDTLTEKEQLTFLKGLVEESGYTIGGDGVYVKGDHKLNYTFTIAGEETDHPAWQAMYNAKKILEKINFQVTVTPDANALKKLSTGDLTVWAAAWGSTIDPDMYQVYHKESRATSVLNWGYKQILSNAGNKYDYENELLDKLSELIDAGRKTTVQTQRKQIYSEALDIVMQLAIELPTYQRNDLYAYNTDKIDVSTLTPDSDLSPYKGLTSDIHNVSFNVER